MKKAKIKQANTSIQSFFRKNYQYCNIKSKNKIQKYDIQKS